MFASVVTSTHEEPQIVPVQLEPQLAGPEDVSQMASTPVHAVAHAPQWLVVLSASSQPFVGSASQSAQPAAHDDAVNPHFPATHVVAPLTCASIVQSFAHVPHVRTSCGDTHVTGTPHVSQSLGHVQSDHWHVGVHVCDPPELHG